MKFCYCDESGTGDEPIAVMAGVIVDSQRMHLTKSEWVDLLRILTNIAGRRVSELHTRDFYAGNNLWRGLSGPKRAQIISTIIEWFTDRKHHVVYTSVVKDRYFESQRCGQIPDELNTIWRFLGFHLVLAVQKCHQSKNKPKGHTIFVFDNEERERMRFTDLIDRPPAWSDSYYERGSRDDALNQVVDVPYFADSREVGLLQVADLISFFLRRYAEIKEQIIGPRYGDEEERVTAWVQAIATRSIGRSFIYPSRDVCECSQRFINHAPASIQSLK